jgi:hypothetical protein
LGEGAATTNANTVLMEKPFRTHELGKLNRRCEDSIKTYLGILDERVVGMRAVWYWLIIVSNGRPWHYCVDNFNSVPSS